MYIKVDQYLISDKAKFIILLNFKGKLRKLAFTSRASKPLKVSSFVCI